MLNTCYCQFFRTYDSPTVGCTSKEKPYDKILQLDAIGKGAHMLRQE